MVTLGVEVYQNSRGLEATGLIDNATLALMCEKRCGERDDLLVEIEKFKIAGDSTLEERLREGLEREQGINATVEGEEISLHRRRRRRHSDVTNATQDTQTLDTSQEERDLNTQTQHLSSRVTKVEQTTDDTRVSDFTPPLQVYYDEYGSAFGREPGQVHLRHHYPVPEGEYDEEGESLLRRALQSSTSGVRISRTRRRAIENARSEHARMLERRTVSASDIANNRDVPSTENDGALRHFLPRATSDFNMALRRRRGAHARTRRSVPIGPTTRFNKQLLVYRVMTPSTKLTDDEVCSSIGVAFRMWAEVTNIDFRLANGDTSAEEIDVEIFFGSRESCLCCTHDCACRHDLSPALNYVT